MFMNRVGMEAMRAGMSVYFRSRVDAVRDGGRKPYVFQDSKE